MSASCHITPPASAPCPGFPSAPAHLYQSIHLHGKSAAQSHMHTHELCLSLMHRLTQVHGLCLSLTQRLTQAPSIPRTQSLTQRGAPSHPHAHRHAPTRTQSIHIKTQRTFMCAAQPFSRADIRASTAARAASSISVWLCRAESCIFSLLRCLSKRALVRNTAERRSSCFSASSCGTKHNWSGVQHCCLGVSLLRAASCFVEASLVAQHC